jgi:hypothetical protein
MVVLTIRPSLSSKRGPPSPRYPTDGKLQNPDPFWTSVIMRKTAPSSVLEIRFLPSCQSGQQLLYSNEDKTALIILLISNASCVKN